MEDIASFLTTYRFHLAAAVLIGWLIYALYHTGKLRKPRFLKRPPAITIPLEQRLAQAEAESQKLQKEVERLTLTIAKMKKEKMEQEIKKMAEEKLTAMLPEKLYLFDPENQLVGRPVYTIGGIPCIDKSEELNRMVERHPLGKISPTLARSLLDKLYFKGDTLYFYTAALLPNGRWAITATSKPPKKTGRYAKLPRTAKQYILLTSQQQNIDDLITNKWEVTHGKAAIILSATFLGPIPIEEFANHYQAVGWLTEFGEGKS